MNDIKKNKKTFLILTISAYVVLAGIMIYKVQQSPRTCPLMSSSSSKDTVAKTETIALAPITVAKAQAKEVKLPRLLELGSKSCRPCQEMEPILTKLTKEYAGVLEISFIDVWLKENEAVGKKYKINSIPVQIFFDAEGKELWRHTGFFSEEDILKKWKELGYDLKKK